MIIHLNRNMYTSLSQSEKQVIDFINQNEKLIPSLSITQLAEKTFTSPPTVSRTIQKCGFSGISELRHKISQQMSDEKRNDSPFIVNSILEKSFRECKETIDLIPTTSILKTIEYLKEAQRIFIFARGFSAIIAEEFQMYLQLLGYNAIIVKDVMWMKKTHRIVKSTDMAIIFSVRNSTPELLESAKTIHRIGAKLVTCCCLSPTQLEDYSDISIIGHSEQIMEIHDLKVYSKIPLFIIARTIIDYISAES
ncbi:MurR/RpiR family transcriptional regulator [Enterococcus gilvus]|uniref:Phosphosugar-binding transcriptional regulator n=1 Tax=Enterococcus gilvus ATCC BAA-350 TaxID=1158614 RepID=R2V718_9ENTE|nr:SIS domain-containing protein [Enterococcus gilvus]EOI53525.1 hypothetical protein UKC_03477 [Enterococcus gilvus ATCC BAA-350]EOW81200.1 hypothetical protein I592_00485 [Enterococcus gilvus ATCC BAA-350]